MKSGDVVRHQPNGFEPETWTVAYARDGRVAPVGYPDREGSEADCELVDACSDADHEAMLRKIAAQDPDGRRGRICEDQLLDLLERRDEFVRVRMITTVRFERETQPRAVPRGHCDRCDRCGWPCRSTVEGSHVIERSCVIGTCAVRPIPALRSTCAGCGAPYEKGAAT